jgi:phosphoesterase RecJ-like protein
MSSEEQLDELIKNSDRIVVIQADNPDGDSLGSSIALEQILTRLNKDVTMFCAVQTPVHLKYLPGWSRVTNELPDNFDMAIIVDTSSISLLEKMSETDLNKLKSKPVAIIDHHQTEATIDFAKVVINRQAVSTGEIIYDLAKTLNWELSPEAKDMLAVSILSDSLGLMSALTTAHSIHIVAELVEGGVNLTHIDNLRKETYRKSLELTKYKGELLKRIETFLDSKLAYLYIPWAEIEKYSPLYNPPMLVIEDMRLIEDNAITVIIKHYDDGHITGKIRSNEGFPLSAKLAEHFGGGGHEYAAGFKTSKYLPDDLKKEIIAVVSELLKDNENI